MSRRDILDAYDDEVSRTHADLDDGRITRAEHKRFMENLTNNLNTDLEEYDRGLDMVPQVPIDEPLVLSLTGTADQMRVWLHLAEQQEPLVRQILSVEPKADLEDIQIWFMSAEEHGQPHTVEEFVEWFKLDDEGNPK